MTTETPGRAAQMRAMFALTRKHDRKMLPLVLGSALLTIGALLGVGFAIGHPIYLGALGVLAAIMVSTAVFGRRATRAAYAQAAGQRGAAAGVLQAMRGDWRVTPAVAITRDQDLVHRVIGRPGVILVGEGSTARVRQLISQERRRVSRVAPETPITEFIVGDEEDQIPLHRLQVKLMRLKRPLKQRDVNEVENRLKALGGTTMPIPKGPMPKSGRIPRRMR